MAAPAVLLGAAHSLSLGCATTPSTPGFEFMWPTEEQSEPPLGTRMPEEVRDLLAPAPFWCPLSYPACVAVVSGGTRLGGEAVSPGEEPDE